MNTNKLYLPKNHRILQTKQQVEQDGTLSLSYKIRKRESGERVYFTIRATHTHRDNLKRTENGCRIINNLWPDARVTSSSPNTVTLNAGWNDPDSSAVDEQFTPQIEHVVKYLQEYINTYDQQPFYQQYEYKTVVLDIVYGLGVAIGGEKYKYASGFRRWQNTLIRFLEDNLEGIDGGDTQLTNTYDPTFGDNKMCECGHPYYRHFDPMEEMEPVGCKYCVCEQFNEHQKE